METVNAKVPQRLIAELDELISEGWYGNRSEAVRDAIRQLIERKRYLQLRKATEEDIRWGLNG
jgi:Arc/MetJ-type ribon-helix-helix transcriptional regulator